MNYVRVTVEIDVEAETLGEAENAVFNIIGDTLDSDDAVSRYQILEASHLED